MKAACFEGFASHADENLLVGGNVFGVEVPVTVGHASFVEWKGLRRGYARGQCEHQTGKNCSFHECLP
jgi:hypothetical protein